MCIADIEAIVSYTDPQYFSDYLKKVGIPPPAYRKNTNRAGAVCLLS